MRQLGESRRDPTILEDRLFFYAGSRDVVAVGNLARALGAGVVVQHPASLRQLKAIGVADLMLDPALYRRDLQTGIRSSQLEDFVRLQSGLGVAAYLSPTGHVPGGDMELLQVAVAQGSEFVEIAQRASHASPAFAVLPIRSTWLTRHLAPLLDVVSKMRVPVALALAAPTNPLESRSAVAGLVALLRAHPTVALLRSDFSMIAALAHGATWGAVGSSTSTRHYVPPGERGGSSKDRSPSLLVRDLMRYMKGGFLGRIGDAGHDIICRCTTCQGRSLGRFYYADPALRAEALSHSLTEVAAAAGNITRHPRSQRPEAWTGLCRRAMELHAEIRFATSLPLPEPDYLAGWVEAGAEFVSHRS